MRWKHIQGTVQRCINCLDTIHAIIVTVIRYDSNTKYSEVFVKRMQQ